MSIFDIEEIGLLDLLAKRTRIGTIDHLYKILQDVDDPDMSSLILSTIDKLYLITDMEFRTLDIDVNYR